jgi:hypothetical protein
VLQELGVASRGEHDPGDDEDYETGSDQCGGKGDYLEIRTETVFDHFEEVAVGLSVYVGVEKGDLDAH